MAFKPVEMTKIRVICLKSAAAGIVKALHNLSAVHVTDTPLEGLERAGPLPSYDEVSARLVKVRTLCEALGGKARAPKRRQACENPVDAADALLAKSGAVFSAAAERDALARELDGNLASQKALVELEGLDIDFSELSSPSLQFMLLKVQKDKEKYAQEILSSAKNCACAISGANGAPMVAVVALKGGQDARFLEGLGQVSPLPPIASTPKRAAAKLRGEEAAVRAKADAAGKRMARLAEALGPQSLALEEALSIEADRARLATQFGATGSLYFIEGWAEKGKFAKIKEEIGRRFGAKAHLSHHEAGRGDVPPTLLDNPGPVRPFEYLTGFASLPQYSEIDPSILLAITIPIMYALIMGDAGYAVISFVLAVWMMKKSKKGELLYEIAMIWAIAAIPAFIAGIAFDEYFGFQHERLIGTSLYQGFHRLGEINTLMIIAIMVGMLHVSLGFILGAINEWHHSRKHAAAKLCWLGILLSGFMMVASLMYGIMPGLGIPSAAVFVICTAGLVMTEGVISAIEIPSLLGNVMSYLRITAVGVAGVIIAEAINELLFPHLEASPAGIAVFIVVAFLYVALHICACVLSMFEALVHGARLNIVEFFGKFYRGGGVRFAPFSARRVHTQEAC